MAPVFWVEGLPIGKTAIFVAFVASLGGFIFGYDTGQISDLVLMDDFLIRFASCSSPGVASTCSFSTVREGLIVALLSVGTFVGAIFGAPTADYFGRRRAMTIECIIFIIGVIIQITSEHVWQQFAMGRFVSGIGVGSLSAAVPMYQAETAPSQIRGTITATYQLFITFGILVAYCISIGTRNINGSGSWRIVVGIGILWPLLLGTAILFMPESPRWLAAHGQLDRARQSLARVRGVDENDPIVVREASEITSNVEHEIKVKRGWLDCFKPGEGKILYRTLLGMGLQSLQQLTGANYFFYYGATVFHSVGISDSFVTQIILGCINFFCTFGGMYVMEKFGRRRPLIVGGLWQSAWLIVFATAGTAGNPDNHGMGTLMIVSACLFIFGYAMTWAPGVWIIIGETFPTATRAKQAALATSFNWLWNFLIAFFTPFITRDIGYKYGYVFAGCNFLGAVVVYFFLYESSDLSLESVDEMYCDPSSKPWTSRTWAPPGYTNRADLIEQTKAAEQHKPLEGGGGIEEARVEKAEAGTPPAHRRRF